MSRLIDADALREYYNVTDPAGTFAYCDSILTCIDNEPTVDAIPVEWLEQWRDKLKGMGEYQHERAEDISFVLGLWQKKQEAQDG